MEPGRREDDAIGHGQPRVDAQACREQGEADVQIDDRALLHDGDCAQRLALIPLLEHALEYLVYRERRDEQFAGRFDGPGEKGRVRAIGEVF
jgi:hypothetical protein